MDGIGGIEGVSDYGDSPGTTPASSPMPARSPARVSFSDGATSAAGRGPAASPLMAPGLGFRAVGRPLEQPVDSVETLQRYLSDHTHQHLSLSY